jgi:hypothetical protein
LFGLLSRHLPGRIDSVQAEITTADSELRCRVLSPDHALSFLFCVWCFHFICVV